MDTYAYFYHDRIDPSNPSENLIASDHTGAGDGQFRINVALQSGSIYVLVITTYYSYTTGSFSVIASGSAPVGLKSITPTSE